MFSIFQNNPFKNFYGKKISWQSIMEISSKQMDNKMPQLIAVTQMCSTADKESNFIAARSLIERASKRGAKMIFLPEGCDFIGESTKQSLELSEPLNGPTILKYRDLAKKMAVWLSIGGIHIKSAEQEKIDNTHILVNDEGNIVSTYVKSHLFEVEIPEKNISLHESRYVNYGHSSLMPTETPCGRLALSICYDMRFPEISLLQRKNGAHILTFPSAFTIPTGMAHWHALLRSRAIETQCYVVASALTGKHNAKRSSYGHSIVVDPWGAVIAETSEGHNIAFAEIDLNYLNKIRKEMPIFRHRRKDLYSLTSSNVELSQPCLAENLPFPADYVNYEFGPKLVPGSCIFLKTNMSYGSVNKKCFVDGHVLVICDKPTRKLSELTIGQMSDISQAVWMTAMITCKMYQGDFQIIVQDGPDAGQTIPHVHFHVLPIHKNKDTFVQGYEAESPGEIKWRELLDMVEEANTIRGTCEDEINQWLYTEDIPRSPQFVEKHTCIKLAKQDINKNEIILATDRICVFPAPEPILEGHSIVYSCDEKTSPSAIVEHFLVAQQTVKQIENNRGNSSTTVYISSVNNKVITHVIPRSPNDLKENDGIYDKILQYNKHLVI